MFHTHRGDALRLSVIGRHALLRLAARVVDVSDGPGDVVALYARGNRAHAAIECRARGRANGVVVADLRIAHLQLKLRIGFV